MGQLNSPYDTRANSYLSLPWVRDKQLFGLIFPEMSELHSVVDLGCGPGALASFVPPHIPYLGIDSSKAMVEQAKNNTKNRPNTNIVKGDFRTFVPTKALQNYTLVLKNVLHLIPHYLSAIQQVCGNLNKARRLIIVETVCPSEESMEWIQSLYLRAGLDHKKNWFERNRFVRDVTGLQFPVIRSMSYEQQIAVVPWLKTFSTCEFSSLIDAVIYDAPTHVRQEMKISEDAIGRLTMLRLQHIVEFDLT